MQKEDHIDLICVKLFIKPATVYNSLRKLLYTNQLAYLNSSAQRKSRTFFYNKRKRSSLEGLETVFLSDQVLRGSSAQKKRKGL